MRSFLFILALCAAVGCGGEESASADGGPVCVVPTVVGFHTLEGGGQASAEADLDLSGVATGPDPVVLASVHVRAEPEAESLGFVEGARLSSLVAGGGMGVFLAGGGAISDDGLLLAVPESGVDLRGLASGQSVHVLLELAGRLPARPLSLTLEVCVKQGTRHATF